MSEIKKTRIVDPHCHFWKPETGFVDWLQQENDFLGDITKIANDYLPKDYLQDSVGFNVEKCVHIEVASSAFSKAEVQWLSEIQKDAPLLAGVVAGSDLSSVLCEEQFEYYSQFELVKGIRQIVSWHDNPRYRNCDRPDYLLDEVWQQGFAKLNTFNLSFDMQVCPQQLSDVAELAGRFSDTQIIINHTGLPIPDELEIWKKGLFELSYRQNVVIKISGFGMLDPQWTTDSIRDMVLLVIDQLGVERIMFASNFPVDRLHASYADVMQAYFNIVQDFSPSDIENLFANNAEKIYRL